MKTLHTIYTSFAKRLAVVLTFLMTIGAVFADTYTWTLASGDLGSTGSPLSSVKKNNVTWTTGYTWGASNATKYFGWDGSDSKKGVQIGAGSSANKCTKAVFSTSDISGTITNVTVNGSHASSGGASIVIKVGGEIVKSSTNFTQTAADYSTGTISKIGQIEITISNSKDKAFYLKSIKVTYTPTPSGYAVTYNNGGRGTAPSNTTASSVTLSEITATGYTHTGWTANVDVKNGSTTINAGTLIANGTTVTLSQATTFTAQWSANKYTVNFTASPNGYGTVSQSKIDNVPYGTVVTSNSNTITINGTTVTANSAEKDADYSYLFNNWSDVPNTITGTCTITANFTRNPRALTNYRTSCSTKGDPNISWSANSCVATMEVDNEFPTLTNPYELSITYLSSDPTVATIDENGTITLLKSGTTTITASYEEDEDYLSASTSYELTVEAANCKWVETEIGEIEPEDEVVVTMTKDVITWALNQDYYNSGDKYPLATTLEVNGNEITEIYDKIKWNISGNATDGYILYPNGQTNTWLYCTGSGNTIKIGGGSPKHFVIENGYLKSKSKVTTSGVEVDAFLGVSPLTNSWRHYPTTTGTNVIADQTLKFYKKECIASDKYWIIYNLENVTCNSEMPNYIGTDGEIELYFSANTGYKLPEQVSITMGGFPLSEDAFDWEAEEGILYILPEDGITGDIVITVEGCELLAIPTNLKANNITSSSATLSWDEIDHATEYQVHITDDDDSTEDIITTTSNTYYEVTGLSSASEYLWGVTPIASGYCGLTQEAEIFTTLDVYTVTFNYQGKAENTTQNVDAGSKITAPANPSAAGYTFNYWYTTDANDPFDFDTPIDGNTTLNAKWTPNVYTITFYKQSGTGGTDNATVTFNSNNYSVSTIEAPTREKYAFGGYYTEQHGAGIQVVNADGNWLKNVAGYTDANGNWIKAEDTHLYAKWTAIYTITWVVNNNTETPYHTSTVLSGSTIDQLPTPPANNLFADCDVNAFVGWSTDNIGLTPDATAPTDLFKTVEEAQNKIGAISVDKKFYAVYASEVEQIATFEADGLNGLSANSTLKWTHDNSGISLAISAGQRYTGSPKTFTITNGTSNYCEIVAPEGKSLKKAVVSITGIDYKVNSVSSPWSLSTSSTTQTITTNTNATDLKMYATSSYQIRITQVDVTYTTYSNYITRCTALPDPVWGGATIDKTEIAVNCGETSSTNGAAKISFLKATNYNLYKDIAVEVTSGNFIIATSRDGEYSTFVTLTPTQSGTNVGTLDGKYVYVRAVAPAMSDEDFTGTITISGKQIATQTITVTADVTCTQYTLTFYDQGQTKTVEGFAGTSVVAPEPWAGICTEPIQYVFDGWAETPVDNGTEEYDKINFSTYTMPDNNTTALYAVYRYAEEGGEPVDGFVKVTEALSDWTGDYVIVDDEYNVAIKNAYKENTNSNKTLAIEEVTIESEKVVSPSANVIWALDKNGENYTMYNEVIKKYAGVSGSGTEKAILSADKHDIQIIFDSKTKIAKVYSVSASRCFEYYVANEEWRTYSSTDARYNTGYLYRFSEKTLRYTSSLICGEISVEEDNVVVTSTKDQKVKVNVPIKVSSYYNDVVNVTGVGESTFSVAAIENVAVNTDETVNLELTYSPSEYDHLDNETITLTASNGATTTFEVNGRSLPENFVIAAKAGNEWWH